MHNRRNFLLQGSLAAAALLITKPSGAINKLQTWFPGLTDSKSCLTIVHGNRVANKVFASGLSGHAFRQKQQHVLMVDPKPTYRVDDTIILQQVDTETAIHFSVIKKGSWHIGMVYAPATGTKGWIKKVDAIAADLKHKYRCNLTVCVWQPDEPLLAKRRPDTQIASATQYIDAFIATSTATAEPITAIAVNQSGNEVIFQYNANSHSCSSIEIGFDPMGNRNHIAFA